MTTSTTGGQSRVVAPKAKSNIEVDTSSKVESVTKERLPQSSGSISAALTKTPSASSSLHTSPRIAGMNDNSVSGEQQQRSSPRLSQAPTMQTGRFSGGVNGSAPIYHTNNNPRARASTSNLPSSTYPNVNHAAMLHSLPASAHLAAQAATAAAVAANAAAVSHHYRAMTSSSSSSPSSSQFHIPNPFLFQHQPFQPMTYEKHTVDLTNSIIAFLGPLLPTEEEYRIKEATRRQLERLAGRVSAGAKLLAFGSMANGFALRNSDMDLCCLIAGAEDSSQAKPSFSASELVETLAKLIREETDYTVMPLPKARIPIIKISRASTPEMPYEISCDIGFENRLALENTRLLLTYAMVDPPRLRTLVLFLKIWTKRRKLNSPYTGTLSSYGYTLLMIFFLSHIKRPAVLPNLQQMPPSSTSVSIRSETVSLNGHNIYFYDDMASLRKEWASCNAENVGELLIDFFRYFSKEFPYSKDVVSIRTETGLTMKDGHVWSSELCIEDPFQAGYNVARTVTRDGLYTIRGEFMRASRLLTTRTDRVSQVLAELCEEREDGLTRAPDTPSQRHRASFGAPSQAMHNSGYAGGFDSRYLRDLTRRYDLSANNSMGGFGGSFAFEEMARGLGQAQKSSNVMAYPPTTAMLAPLSQNTGLSPRQHLMRAGLRYDTPRRGQSGSPMGHPSNSLINSSTRSEDGNSNYDKKKSKRFSSSSTVSAQTSPNLDNSVPSFLHPNSAGQGDYSTGETLAYGSEISFGSQRFQLHPQPSSLSSRSGNVKRAKDDNLLAPRSFSDGLNRSLSLPRSNAEANEMRRASTPLLSEPTSPSKILVGLPDQGKYLEPSMASLSLRNGHATLSPRSSVSGSGSSGGNHVGVHLCSSQPNHSIINSLGKANASQLLSSSPRLPPSPWSLPGQDSQVALTPEEDGSFGLDDEPASISDADESARLNSSHDQSNGVCSVDGQDDLSQGKEHAIRSWAESQSAGIHSHPTLQQLSVTGAPPGN